MTDSERPSGRQLVALKDQIVGGFSQSNWIELGAITNMQSDVERHHRLLRSLSWGDEDYEGHVLTMLRNMIDRDPDNYALILDYVSRTCPEGGELVSSEDLGARRITFSPLVFSVPDERPNVNLVSVMMPFDVAMMPVYDAIKEAAEQVGLDCARADNIWEESTVIQDVFNLIFRSYIVVCDFSGRNPNVFYEAGIAHTLGKHVIPITQGADDIPFDLRHHRYAKYLNNNEGRDQLMSNLADRFRTLKSRQLSV